MCLNEEAIKRDAGVHERRRLEDISIQLFQYETIVTAWILRHPARILPAIGTTNTQRLLLCIQASDIALTREERYEIYLSAGNYLPL